MLLVGSLFKFKESENRRLDVVLSMLEILSTLREKYPLFGDINQQLP